MYSVLVFIIRFGKLQMQPEFGKRDPTVVVLPYNYVLTSKYVWDTLKVRKAVDIIYLSSNDSIQNFILLYRKTFLSLSSKCLLKREKSNMLYNIFNNLVLSQKACSLAKAFTSLRYKTSVKTKVKTQMRQCTRISRPRFLQKYQKDNFFH